VGMIKILCSYNCILEHSFCINITRLLDVIPCILVDMCHNLEGTWYLCIRMRPEGNIVPLPNIRHDNLSLFVFSHFLTDSVRILDIFT